MSTLPDTTERKADFPIEPLFTRRWSPRAMTGERINDQRLMTLFEAARWAPSSYNEQEWRFVYAARETAHWSTLFEFLVPDNQAWCKNASHLIIVLSKRTFTMNGKPNAVHEFDSGAAFQNLCLQAAALGLVAHGMAGFNRDAVREKLAVPEDFAIHAMVAVGIYGNVEALPPKLQEIDKPSTRKPLSALIAEGIFQFS